MKLNEFLKYSDIPGNLQEHSRVNVFLGCKKYLPSILRTINRIYLLIGSNTHPHISVTYYCKM